MKQIIIIIFCLIAFNSYSQKFDSICNTNDFNLYDDLSTNNDLISSLKINLNTRKDLRVLKIKICEIEKLSNLRCIDFYSNINKLKFPIFDKIKNKNIENLTVENIDIRNNTIGLLQLKKLKSLCLVNVGLDSIPKEIEQFYSLHTLDLSSNNLNEISILLSKSSVEWFYLSNNPKLGLSESLKTIGEMENLKELNLAHTGLKVLPATFSSLKSLKSLSLNLNNIDLDSVIFVLKKIPFLSDLSMTYCNLDKIPEMIKECKSIETLNLSNNNLDNHDLTILTNLKNLGNLNCSYNKDISLIPKEIGNLKNLIVLDVSATSITEFPIEMKELINLKKIYICNTNISNWQIQKLKESLPNCDIRTNYLN